jgi:hypothetical protein
MFQQFSKRLVTEQVLSCARADVRRSLWAPPHLVKNFIGWTQGRFHVWRVALRKEPADTPIFPKCMALQNCTPRGFRLALEMLVVNGCLYAV